jgi:hypothetical protein
LFSKRAETLLWILPGQLEASQKAVETLPLDSDPSDCESDHSAGSGDATDTDVASHQYHNITVHCAGSAFDRFQPTLCELRSHSAKMSTVKLRLEPEPDNVKDKNALLGHG